MELVGRQLAKKQRLQLVLTPRVLPSGRKPVLMPSNLHAQGITLAGSPGYPGASELLPRNQP